jgi:hypothetical protein
MRLKFVIALLAIATIGVMAMPNESFARRGGWHGHGGWHGGWRGGWGGWRGGYYPYYAAYPYSGCYRTVRVATPYGWTWRRVWVCG